MGAPLRIDLVAPPMSGHLHPLLGIGRRLARDSDVRVISTPGVQRDVVAAGLTGHALLSGGDDAIAAIVEPPRRVGSHPLRLHAQLKGNLALSERVLEELLALWRSSAPDLVIADFAVPVAGSAAIACGIRWWTTVRIPCAMETSDGPPGYLGGWRPRPGLVGRARDAAGRAVVRGFKRTVHRLHRPAMRRLGFPALYRSDGSEAIYSPECVLALSLAELDFPRRYPPAVEFVGPVLYTPPADAPPPPFVAGRKHVLVSLGTHLHWRRAAVAEAVRAAAAALPELEFHLSEGDRSSRSVESSGNLHRIGFVSYERDLSRYALVVHHGGSGVLSHTLAAGRPAVVMPVDYDQLDNAARLEVAGVALWLRRLEDLARSITRALGDASMASACRRMQLLLAAGRAEDRVAERVSRALS